jgi:hypothetical protein
MTSKHEQDRALLRWIRRANTFDLHLAYTRCKRTWIQCAISRELTRRKREEALQVQSEV